MYIAEQTRRKVNPQDEICSIGSELEFICSSHRLLELLRTFAFEWAMILTAINY